MDCMTWKSLVQNSRSLGFRKHNNIKLCNVCPCLMQDCCDCERPATFHTKNETRCSLRFCWLAAPYCGGAREEGPVGPGPGGGGGSPAPDVSPAPAMAAPPSPAKAAAAAASAAWAAARQGGRCQGLHRWSDWTRIALVPHENWRHVHSQKRKTTD